MVVAPQPPTEPITVQQRGVDWRRRRRRPGVGDQQAAAARARSTAVNGASSTSERGSFISARTRLVGQVGAGQQHRRRIGSAASAGDRADQVGGDRPPRRRSAPGPSPRAGRPARPAGRRRRSRTAPGQRLLRHRREALADDQDMAAVEVGACSSACSPAGWRRSRRTAAGARWLGLGAPAGSASAGSGSPSGSGGVGAGRLLPSRITSMALASAVSCSGLGRLVDVADRRGQVRRDDDHQLGLVALPVGRAEQRAQHRQVRRRPGSG